MIALRGRKSDAREALTDEGRMPAPADRKPLSTLDLRGFFTLPENRSAVRAVKALARAVLRGKRSPVCPLVLHGPPGTGKTLLTAAVLGALAAGPEVVTARSVVAAELARPDAAGEDAGFADRDLRACDFLVIEDVQHLPERAADAACDLIDRRAARRRALVVTAGAGPAALTHLPRRLTSRLAAGLVVQLGPLGAASRRTVLAAAAKARNVRLAPDALDWLAGQGGGLRAALGLVQNLALVALQFPGPLDRKSVEEIVAGTGQPTSRGADLAAIMKRVAAAFGVTEKELLGSSRLRTVLVPRQVAMYLARELTGLSLPRIGTAFDRDHTTVLHACRKVEEAVETDAKLAAVVRQLRSELV
jgi:chromosomal replication initiator protein